MMLDSSTSKKHPYKVPEKYFEELPMRVMKQVEKKPSKSIFYFDNVWFRIGVVSFAVCTLLVLGIQFFKSNPSPTPDYTHAEMLLSQVSKEEIKAYLFSESDNIELVELAEEKNISVELSMEDINSDEELLEEIDLSEIEDYL
ncbi:MAG: hypothetical protein OHK0038_20720 [Flammeovirgaceae bacterium]